MNDYSNRKRDAMGRVGGEMDSVTIMPPSKLTLKSDSGESMIRWKRLPSGELSITSIDGVTYGDGEEVAEEVTEDMQPTDQIV
jgi:hypothetical protein